MSDAPDRICIDPTSEDENGIFLAARPGHSVNIDVEYVREFFCPLGPGNTPDICPAGSCLRCLSRRLEESQAENARLREAQAWQPIETAPKDGTLFVAVGFVKEHAYATVGGFELWDIEEGIWGFHDHNASEWFEDEKDWPTHWMPLPEAPEETGK